MLSFQFIGFQLLVSLYIYFKYIRIGSSRVPNPKGMDELLFYLTNEEICLCQPVEQ